MNKGWEKAMKAGKLHDQGCTHKQIAKKMKLNDRQVQKLLAQWSKRKRWLEARGWY